ncbi:MAG: biotin--[acetyl-CoA-carboxylase] ligase [Solirubrobacterales bacterium]
MNQALGSPRLHFRRCESTNSTAKSLAEAGAPHGTTVTADEQTSGRGRQGRAWVAPASSALLVSALVRPVVDRHKLAPLAAALAVAETCERLADVRAAIKWPNDVWIDGRKVAGILVEARPDRSPERSWMVVGIGLNTRVRLAEMPPELQQTAYSLNLPVDVEALPPLLARLDHWLGTDTEPIVAAWRERDALQGRRIAWADGEGEAAGVDELGNLIVIGDDGASVTLIAGEVHLSVG